MSEIKDNQTSNGGKGYVHPRGDKYRDNYEKIFGPHDPKEEENGG